MAENLSCGLGSPLDIRWDILYIKNNASHTLCPPSPHSARQARLEPPLPLLCSQPGSSVAKYAHLQQELARLQQATAVLGRGQAACLSALCAAAAGPAPTAAATEQLRSVLAHATALSAAACAGAAQALAHMPALAPCAGAALRWRPLPAGAWAEARAELAAAARQAAAAYQQSYQEQGLDFALGLHVEGVSWRAPALAMLTRLVMMTMML